MVNFVEILFGIAIGSTFVGILSFVQSKSGGERAVRYRERMRQAFTIAIAVGVLAVIGEILLQMNT